jgi:hypothetical protein
MVLELIGDHVSEGIVADCSSCVHLLNEFGRTAAEFVIDLRFI